MRFLLFMAACLAVAGPIFAASSSFPSAALPMEGAVPAVWQPASGDQAMEFGFFGQIDAGWLVFYTDRFSQENEFSWGSSDSLNLDNGITQDWQSWENVFTLESLQRFRLARLGSYGTLNLSAGPFFSYEPYTYSALVGTDEWEQAYTVGLKAGVEVEFFPVARWSIKGGYYLSGGWSEENIDYQRQPYYDRSIWGFSSGSAEATVNYYFR